MRAPPESREPETAGPVSPPTNPAPSAPVPDLDPFTTGRFGRVGDTAFKRLTLALALGIPLIVVGLLASMIVDAAPALAKFGPAFLWTSNWNPVTGDFGVLPAIYGTVATSLLGLLIAVPLGIGSAIFLVEFAPPWLSRPLSLLIELLAAVPSVVIGLWGALILVPAIEQIEEPIGNALGFIPLFSGPPLGIGLLSAGVILAIMVLPILTAVIRDILLQVPRAQREAMLAIGATPWETIVRAVVPYGRSGIVGAVILALGRALGETLAVTMVIGNTYNISPSLFSPATTLASLVASQFREADSSLYLSSLIAAGLVLFLIAVVVNVLARVLVWQTGPRAATGGAR